MLRRYGILDTPADPAFDDLTQLASCICDTPSALLTLIDTERQWFKSRHCFEALETPRALAFCAHTILQGDVLVVSDAAADARFADNELVTGPPGIRFYAGVPLLAQGHPIGSIAVIDYVPRMLVERQKAALRALSRQAVAQLEIHRTLVEQAETARDQAERALAIIASENTTILESSLDCVVTMDHRGIILEFNRVAEATFGYLRGDAVGRELAELIIPPSMRERHRSGMARYLATGAHAMLNRRTETVALHADGHSIPVELMVTRLGDSDPPRFTGFIRDLTTRKQDELAVREGVERYRELVEDVPDAIFTFSVEGVVTSGNRAVETMLGGPRDQWIDRSLVSLVHEAERGRATELFRRVRSGERPPSMELTLTSSTGSEISIELTVTPRFVNESVVSALGVGRDITHRKRLEQELRQSQKMEAIGLLSGGVAHDFNNLLTVIQCNASLLTDMIDNSEGKEHVGDILRAAERAAGLTRQLLQVSRKQVMQPATLDLNTVVREMMKLLERVLGEDIELRCEYGGTLPLLRGDTGMLEQVVLNLVVNARDAMPRGGRLTIATTTRTVDDDEAIVRSDIAAGRYVCLSVRDTGGGISPAVLPHLFEPFFTTKEVSRGTGLGLATVYGIAKQHGGWIDVDTELGSGSKFSVYLAVADDLRPDPRAMASTRDRATRGTETILVVEDEFAIRSLVVNLLERQGYSVLQAASGAEALVVWREHPAVELLLTDLVLPAGITGRELAERMRHDRPSLKVMYTSGYSADLAGPTEELVEGVNFLQKPYQPQKLAQTVRAYLDRR